MTCTRCPLGGLALTNCMEGINRGPILFVLSNPSSEDDLAGGFQPDSRGGRLLREIAKDAGLRDEDFSLAFATRCATNKTRPVQSSDLDACREYLRAEIKLLRPSSIIAFGNDSLRALTKLSGIKEKRGKAHPLHADFEFTCDVFPTYAVSDVFRVPNYRSVIISDLRRVRDLSLPKPEIAWEWWNGQDLPKSDYYAFDIETNYFDTVGTDIPERVTQAAIAGEAFCFVSLQPLALLRLLEKQDNIVGHNSWGFDVPKLRQFGVNLPLGHDTMVLAYLDDETQPLGLESLSVKYLGVRGWKEEFEHALGSDEFATYNARDVRYTYKLHANLRGRLGERIRTAEQILAPARTALDNQTRRGIWINGADVAAARAEAEKERDSSLAVLRGLAGPKFNPGSTKQVAAYLINSGEELPKTASGKPATGLEVLKTLDNTFAQELVRYRSAVKTLGTYVIPYEKIVASLDGRVHPDYTLVRTLTGRSSARNLNVQNIDRDLKGFFGAPKDHVFVSVDYSAIEFRVAAWYAREQKILSSYGSDVGWDAHRFFASSFYRKPESEVTKLERQIAKSANFGLLYLGNAFTLYEYANKQGVAMDLTTADKVYKFWHQTFPGFKKFYAEVRHEIETTSQSACPTGHVRHFGDFNSLLPGMRLEALRQAVNVKVQNLAAHLAYISMAELDRLGMPLIGFIHDAFLFEFESLADYEQNKQKMEEIMCLYPKEFLQKHFNIDFDMPLAVEFEHKVGT